MFLILSFSESIYAACFPVVQLKYTINQKNLQAFLGNFT